MTCLVGEVSTKNEGDEGQGGAARRGGKEGRDEAVYRSGRGGCLERQCIQLPYRCMMAGKNEKAMTTTAMTTTTTATTTVMATMNDADDSMGVELKGK